MSYSYKFILLLLVTIAESYAVYAGFIIQYDPSLFIILHCVIAGVFSAIVLLVAKGDVLLIFTVLTTIFTSVFGSLCGFVALMVHHYIKQTATFSQWFATMFPDEEILTSDRVYQRIIFGLDEMGDIDKLEPFKDIMSYGTLGQKQMVIAKITRYFRPLFAPILFQALNATDNSIRVQAASALSKIEDDFMTSYMQQKELLSAHPDDGKKQLELAKFCQSYASCGILKDMREAQILAEAIGLYKLYIKTHPDDAEVDFALGKLFLQQADMTQAIYWLEQCVEMAEDKASAEYLFYYFEALFRDNQYQKLRSQINNYREHIEMFDIDAVYSIDLKDSLQFWGAIESGGQNVAAS